MGYLVQYAAMLLNTPKCLLQSGMKRLLWAGDYELKLAIDGSNPAEPAELQIMYGQAELMLINR